MENNEQFDIIMNLHNLQMPCCSKSCPQKMDCHKPVCAYVHKMGYLRRGLKCAEKDKCILPDCLFNHPAQLKRYAQQMALLAGVYKEVVPQSMILLKFICMNNQKSFYLNLNLDIKTSEIARLILEKERIIGPLITKIFYKNKIVDENILRVPVKQHDIRNGDKMTFSWKIDKCSLLQRITLEQLLTKKQIFGYLSPHARMIDLQRFVGHSEGLLGTAKRDLRFTFNNKPIPKVILKKVGISTGDIVYWRRKITEVATKGITRKSSPNIKPVMEKRKSDKQEKIAKILQMKKKKKKRKKKITFWMMSEIECRREIVRSLFPKIKQIAYSHAPAITKELLVRQDLDNYDLAYLLHDDDELIRVIKGHYKYSLLFAGYN